jgi:glycerol-3-phosphate responsive antiterminator
MADTAAIRLPRILIADTGHNGTSPPPGLDAGILLRTTDLAALIECALSSSTPPAVELDSIRGLGSDDAAVDFLRHKLSIEIMLTRRPQAADAFAAAGGLALLNVLAFDSTGLRRSLHAHPRRERVGTVISPGLVLHHMLPSELALLVRPLVAYGLIDTAADALATLAVTDGIVVRPEVALGIAESEALMRGSGMLRA